jgi:hypothetical protein
MTAGLEGLTVARWVYGTLTTSQALADALGVPLESLEDYVWEGVAPGGLDYWVVFTVQSPRDVKGATMTQIMSAVAVQVKVVGKAQSYGPLAGPYKAAHDALEGRTNQPVQDGLVLTCHRVSGVQYPEQVNGIEYRHLGGLYETNAQ